MKKIIYLAISIMMMAMLTGCLSWPEADSVLIESDIPIDTSNPGIPIPDDLQYFETIEEAIMNNDLELQNLSIDKRIKLFENDEYAVLFCRENNIEGNDGISAFRCVVMETDGTRKYSTPIAAARITWNGHKLSVNNMKLDEIGEVRLCISRDILRHYRIDDTKNFFWGISQTDRSKNLKIEGQPATEVIEVELDDEIGYFWYFDDLETGKHPLFKDIRIYTEGEFIITMD